jgi:hypothetical protein
VVAAQVEIISEFETAGGWRFVVQALDGAGAVHRCTMTLSWADYDLWSGGADDPAEVAEAVIAFIMDRGGALRETFDASIVRRLYEGADGAIPRMIG